MSRRLIALLVACTAGAATSAQVPTPDNPFGLPPGTKITLEFFDSIIAGMKSAVWTAAGAAGNPPPDHRGRTIQQDMDEYLQTDGYLAELAKVRDALPAAIPPGAADIPPAAAEPMFMVITSEGCRFITTLSYWELRGVDQYHARLIRSLQQDLPAAERQAIDARLGSFHGRVDGFGDRLASDVAGCGQRVARDPVPLFALLNDYNSLRAELVERLYELKINLPDPDKWVERADPCPPPATTTTGQPGVKVAGTGNAFQYYDDESKKHAVAGRAQIRLEISPTGCVTRASVARTSGAPLLDQGALQAAFSYWFIPGEKDGKPIGQSVVLPVSFSLPPPPIGTTP